MDQEEFEILKAFKNKDLFLEKGCLKKGEKSGGLWIGGGDYGSVSVICLNDEIQSENCEHVIKAIKIDNENELKDAKYEAEIAELVSDIKIGSKFVRSFGCKTTKGRFYFIITERYDTDLKKYIKKCNKDCKNGVDISNRIISLKKALVTLMLLCIKKHFYHADLCSYSPGADDNGINEGNIILKVDSEGNVFDAKLTDFDRCEINISKNEEFEKKIVDQWCCLWRILKTDEDYKSFKFYILETDEIKKICQNN